MRPKPSSAANGRLSQGPTTQAGKDRSRFNAVKHGLSARRLLLIKGESPEELEYLAASFKNTLQPASIVEGIVVDCMVASEWRLSRAQAMESAMMERAIEKAPPEMDPADVMFEIMESKAFSMLCRYQTMLENSFSRGIRTLTAIKKNFPIDQSLSDDLPVETDPDLPESLLVYDVVSPPPEPVQPEPVEARKVAPRPLTFSAVADTATISTADATPPAHRDSRPDPHRTDRKAAA